MRTELNEAGEEVLILQAHRALAVDDHNEKSVVHAVGRVDGFGWWQSCCHGNRLGRISFREVNPAYHVTCIYCMACRGCIACKDDMITPETTAMKQWVTARKEHMWPFQMDAQHLCNAIRKLHRDQALFKRDWEGWVKCLEAEARLRGLTW